MIEMVAAGVIRVDTFWRFVSALGIGIALLVVSFLYQRRARRSAEEPPKQAEAG